MPEPVLTPAQEAAAQRLAAVILEKAREETLRIARLLVSKPDEQILGATEFEVRDRVHALGASAIEAALNERKKGATKVPVPPARTAAKRPRSRNTGPKTS